MATEDDEPAFAAEQSSERRAGSFPNLRSGCPRNSLEHVRLGHELGVRELDRGLRAGMALSSIRDGKSGSDKVSRSVGDRWL